MRLSWLSSLGISVALLVSTSAFAQHSSGGSSGGSGGGSSSSGGSHGGGGGSSSSGGSHGSSGGSSSGHSSAHGSSGSSSSSSHSHVSGSNSVRSTERNSHTNNLRSMQEGNRSSAARPAQAEKRGFFSFFRRGFRRPEPKPEPKPVSDLRHKVRICLKGPCAICPAGEAAGGGGCVTRYKPRRQDLCSLWNLTSTSACRIQSGYFDECVAEHIAMEQEAKRAQAAEQDRFNACTAGQTAECSDLTTRAQSENGYYRMLQDRYEQCRQRNGGTFPFGNITFRGHANGQALDRLDFEFEYR
jgi:hypothetical protein